MCTDSMATGDNVAKEIETLAKQTKVESATKVVSEALSLYKWAVGERRKGREIVAINPKTGKGETVHLPGLDYAGTISGQNE